MASEIQIKAGGHYETKTFVFPGGELQVQITGLPESIHGEVRVLARLQSASSLVQLLLAAAILEQTRRVSMKTLVVPYFPYARQDRVMQPAEAFSLKAVARFVNSLGFDEVVAYDPHSDVTAALVNHIRVIPQVDLVSVHERLAELLLAGKAVVVAPDAGAAKKAFAIAQRFGLPLVTGSKARDTTTGEITRAEVPPTHWAASQDAVIVDDICDGGRTFIELAKVLRTCGANRVFLYVTHGIFSQGLGVFDGIIDAVFTTDSFLGRDVESPHQSPVPLHVSPVHF